MLLALSAADALAGEGRFAGEADGLGELKAAVPLSFNIHGVIAPENPGNVHALRTGNTVAAAGASHLFPRADAADHALKEIKILPRKIPRTGFIRGAYVFPHHFQRIHTGEDHGDLRLVIEPAEGPFRRAPATGIPGKGFPGLLREHVDQFAAAQGLHDDHRNVPGGGGFQPLYAGLGVFIQVVVLDLAEIPVVILQDFQEVFRVSVIGKPDIPDRSRRFFIPDPVQDTGVLQPFPLGVIRQVVHEVIIHIIRLQPGKLLQEQFLHAADAADHIMRQLGGDVHVLPDAVPGQDGAQQRLAAGIDIGGVIVIDTGAEGGHDLLLRLVNIQGGTLPGKAHAAESEHGQAVSVLILPVLHWRSLPISFFIRELYHNDHTYAACCFPDAFVKA